MAKSTPPKSRRREVRKNVVLEKTSLRKLLSQRHVSRGLLFALVFWVLASALVLRARQQSAYHVGQVIDTPVVARVDVEWIDEEMTQRDRERARNEVKTTYRPDEEHFEVIRQKLVALPGNMANAQSLADVAEQTRLEFALDSNAIEVLRGYQTEGNASDGWLAIVDGVVRAYRMEPIISGEQYQIERSARALGIKLRHTRATPDEHVSEMLMINLADQESMNDVAEDVTRHVPGSIRDQVANFIAQQAKPNYFPDKDTTNAERQAAADAVKPEKSTYPAGAVLVARSELKERAEGESYVTVLTPEQLELIGYERELYHAQLSGAAKWLRAIAPVFVVLLITLGVGAIVLSLRPRIAENPVRGLTACALLLASLALATLVSPFGAYTALAGAITAAAGAAMILAIAYEPRLAVGVGVLQCLLISVALSLTVGQMAVAMVAVVVSVGQLHEVRLRGTLVRVGLVTGCVAGASSLAVGLLERGVVPGIYGAIAWQAAWVFGGAVVVGFFINGTLRFIETTFKVTTAMTLLELCDVNRPLLRKLAQAAPGTYNHSLNIAVLAENAAEAIGANGLLCRVGAMYHDIGKMNKPAYFIENQAGGPNRHEKLSPAMSLLIITGHVKDGVEMAKEYGLPKVLHQFIATHHGTTLVEYFYHAAKRQSVLDDQAQPSEFEFRYPGPKPRSREAAILMLCDIAESACRTLDEPTHNRIEQLVHNLAIKRLMDGQFDDSALTLEELHRVEESITKSLVGIYHGRVKYPAGDKEREQADVQNKDRAAG